MVGTLVKLASVVIAIVEVNGSTIEGDGLADAQVISGEELAVLLDVLLALEELALRDAGVLEFLLVDGDGVVLEVEEDLDLAVAAVLLVALDHALLEVAEEAQHVPVEVHPVRLVELGGVSGRIFGVEVVVGGGEEGGVVDLWLLIGRLAGERVFGGFLLVDIPIVLLLLGTDLLVVLLELLRGREARQQRKIACHLFYNLLKYYFYR